MVTIYARLLCCVFFLSCSKLENRAGTLFQPTIVITDTANHRVECQISIRVYAFTDTVSITLEVPVAEEFEAELFEELLGHFLNLDIVVSSTSILNDR